MTSVANPVNYWFFLTWCWLASAIIIAGTFAAEFRRHIQPLKARDRVLSLLTNAAYLAGTLIRSAITFRPDLPCLYDIWQAPITIGFLSSIYLLRSWRMYFKFELAHERSLLRLMDNGKQASEGHRRSISMTATAAPGTVTTWYSDRRYLISDRFTIVFTSISVLIFFVPNVINSFAGNFVNIEAGSAECRLSSFMSFWQTMWGLIYLLGLLIFAIKLRKTFDAFGIKVELKAVFWLNVLSWTIVTALAVFTDDRLNIKVFNFRKLAPLVFMMLLFVQTTAIPIYRTFESGGGTSQNAINGSGAISNDINTLTGLLKSPEGFAAFQQYLIGCFCVESCLFWKDIEEYRAQVLASLRKATQQRSKNLPDLQHLLGRAREINLIYIKEESRLQVNISASQRQRVENAVNNLLVKYEPMIDAKDTAAESVFAKSHEVAVMVGNNNARSSMVGLLPSDGPRSSVDGGQPETPENDNNSPDDKPLDESAINPELKDRFKDILNVFNIAQLEVIELMRTDPYPRFRMTKQFNDLVQQAEIKQHRIDALRDLNVI